MKRLSQSGQRSTIDGNFHHYQVTITLGTYHFSFRKFFVSVETLNQDQIIFALN